MEGQAEKAAWRQGEGFHILFQIMMYLEASVGLDGQTEPHQRPLCAVRASVFQGFASE